MTSCRHCCRARAEHIRQLGPSCDFLIHIDYTAVLRMLTFPAVYEDGDDELQALLQGTRSTHAR